MGKWANAIGTCMMLYLGFWCLNGWKEEERKYVGEGDGYVRGSEHGMEEKVRMEFDATMEMAERRKSNVIGQIVDYLRFKDQEVHISVKVYLKKELNDLYMNALVTVNISLPYVENSINKEQILRNYGRCGSSNLICYTQKVDFNDIQLTNQYFAISTKSNIGSLEIDDQLYSVESKLYLNAYHDKNENKSSYDNISFIMFLKEIKANNNSYSKNELYISTKESFYYLSSYIYLLISLCVKLVLVNGVMYRLKISHYPQFNSIKLILLILFLPLMYATASLELKILIEMCHLNTNIFLYLALNILILLLSFC